MTEETRKLYAWRRRAARGLPALAGRVFALRGKRYPGCGFHYALERRLGLVLADLNNFDRPLTCADQLCSEIGTEELYRDVRLAERGVST